MGIATFNIASTNKGEDHWYTHNKWKDLPEDKQASIWKAHAACKSKVNGGKRSSPKKGKPSNGKFGRKEFRKLEQKVQNQRLQLAANCCGSQVQ
jgi:hypothetical protein